MMCKNRISLAFILVFSSAIVVNGNEQERTSGNFKNPAAVKEVLNGTRKIANAAWWGFDKDDSTYAIQQAINSGARTVIVPYIGADWIVEPIKLAGNQEIIFEPGVVVIAKKGSFKGKYDCLFSAFRASNITIRGYGAVLRMRKKDYQGFRYTKSEHRHVISLTSCNDVNILGLRLESSGGDGIFLTRDREFLNKYDRSLPCKDILIRDCVCDNNYRQGISVISAENLLIENCVFSNTRGTPPRSGIDLEPNHPRDMLVNVVIRNCISENNFGPGFIASVSWLTASSREISVLFVDCYARNCVVAGFFAWVVEEKNRPRGLIEFRNCTSENITSAGALATWKIASPLKVRFNNCKWRNVATEKNKAPIQLTMKKTETVNRLGGIEFVNCYVYDDRNRPFLKIIDVEGGQGVYDIKGDINVCNPYGARTEPAKAGEELALKIYSFRTLQ